LKPSKIVLNFASLDDFSAFRKGDKMKKIPVIEYRKELPYTKILLYFPSGSSVEDESTAGFAHFCEHLAFKLRVKGEGIADFVEGKGGSCNAYTSHDLIVFEATVLNEFVGETLKFYEKVFEKGLESIDENDFKEEKKVVLQEMVMYEDEPLENLFTGLMHNMFPGSGYGRKIIGTREALERSERSDLAEFFAKKVMRTPFLVLSGGYEKSFKMKLKVDDNNFKPKIPNWKVVNKFDVNHDQKKNYFIAGWKLPKQDGRIDACLRMISTLTYGMDGARFYNELVYDNPVFDNLNISSIGGSLGSLFLQSGAFPSDKVKMRLEKWTRLWDGYSFSQTEVARAREVILSNEYFSSEGLGSMPEVTGKSYMLFGDKEKLEKDFFYEFMHLTADDLNEFKKEHLSLDKMIFGLGRGKNCRFKAKDLKISQITSSVKEKDVVRFKKPGVKAAMKNIKGSSILSLYILKKSGVFSNIKGKPGSFKLFLESMCTRANGMERQETEAYLDRFGITLSPVYGNNTGGIKVKVRDNFVNEAVDIVGKILDNKIDETDFEQEKQYTLSNLSIAEENPGFHVQNKIHEELFKGTAYENTAMGTASGIKGTKFSDVRKIREKFFKTGNFAVAMAGSTDGKILHDLSQSISRKGVKKNIIKPFDFEDLKEQTIRIPLDARKQVHISRVFRGPSVYDADFDTVKLMDNYMMGQKSPYFQELREKQGLVYSLDVAGMGGMLGGYIVFSAITSPENIEKVMEGIERSAFGLIDGQINESYLEETKNGLITSLAKTVVQSNYHAFNLALDEALGQPEGQYMKQLEIIRSISKDSITESAQKWLSNGMWILAGDV